MTNTAVQGPQIW